MLTNLRRSNYKDKIAKGCAKSLLISMMCLIIHACTEEHHFAPVLEVNAFEAIPKTGSHRVLKGESLYEIAWRYGMDYRLLAALNQIEAPYPIHPGQMIVLKTKNSSNVKIKPETINVSPKTTSVITNKSSVFVLTNQRQNKSLKQISSSIHTYKNNKEPNYSVIYWIWPARGKILNSFSPMNKGINISGQAGQDIYATAAGKVVYAGNGLRGYGNLIILKHNNLYLSAYAHMRSIAVSEGAWVTEGQKIAEMGNSGADQVMLHFEIRRAGKPIDPFSLLQ